MKKYILLMILCLACVTGLKAQQYNFSRTDCTLFIKKPGGQIVTSMNLHDLKWREPANNLYIEVNDYSNSFTMRDAQINNFANIDALTAQLVIWKDSCLTDAGVVIDATAENGISGDGTVATPLKLGGDLTENTNLALASYTLSSNGTGVINLTNTIAGTTKTGTFYSGNNALGFGPDAVAISVQDASNSYLGVMTFGDLTNLGQTANAFRLSMGGVGGAQDALSITSSFTDADSSVTTTYSSVGNGYGDVQKTWVARNLWGKSLLRLESISGNASARDNTRRLDLLASEGNPTTNEWGIRVQKNLIAIDNDKNTHDYLYALPYSGPADNQFLVWDTDTDTIGDWTYTTDAVQQADITGVTLTVNLASGNVIRINSATANDTLVLPPGIYDAQEVVISNRSGVAVNVRSNADVNGNASYNGAMSSNALFYLRWSATEPEWLIGE